jgi:PIN domain nuclease of toxin-antitoxin system
LNLLLDTHALILALDTPERLPNQIRDLFSGIQIAVFS